MENALDMLAYLKKFKEIPDDEFQRPQTGP